MTKSLIWAPSCTVGVLLSLPSISQVARSVAGTGTTTYMHPQHPRQQQPQRQQQMQERIGSSTSC
jgi:hypothetical protein